jgi:hypothetical protein
MMGRKGPREPGTFAVEWPPHDGSLDKHLPRPHGASVEAGCGCSRNFQDHDVWSPERSRLVGLACICREQDKEEVVVRIELWLEVVGNQIPELRGEVKTILEQLR